MHTHLILLKCFAQECSNRHTGVISHVYLYRHILLKYQLTGQQFIPSQMQRARFERTKIMFKRSITGKKNKLRKQMKSLAII